MNDSVANRSATGESALTKSPAALLEIDGISKHFGGLVAVDNVGFTVAPGTVTAVIGPNGAGKSTLFNAIAGTLRPDTGRVRFDGHDITGWPAHRVAGAGIARTFQAARMLLRMTVLENLMLAAADQSGESLLGLIVAPRRTRRSQRAIAARAQGLLEQMGLAHLAGQYARVLSGGQRKLLEFARVLMAEPRLVLLDEPLAGVNRTIGARLLGEIGKLRANGVTFLLIEHDLEAVMSTSDTVVVMSRGQVLAAGPPAQVRVDQRVVDAYLGAAAPDPGEPA